MTTPQQLELFSVGEPRTENRGPKTLPAAPPAPIRDPAGVLIKAGWWLDPNAQTRIGATWHRNGEALVLPHAALDQVAAWVRANPKLTAAQITQRRELLDGLANAATNAAATPEEFRQRGRDGRCLHCDAELSEEELLNDRLGWCERCSAEVMRGATESV